MIVGRRTVECLESRRIGRLRGVEKGEVEGSEGIGNGVKRRAGNGFQRR